MALTNVLFTLNRTTRSSKTLLCVVRFNVNKTLLIGLSLTKRNKYLFEPDKPQKKNAHSSVFPVGQKTVLHMKY